MCRSSFHACTGQYAGCRRQCPGVVLAVATLQLPEPQPWREHQLAGEERVIPCADRGETEAESLAVRVTSAFAVRGIVGCEGRANDRRAKSLDVDFVFWGRRSEDCRFNPSWRKKRRVPGKIRAESKCLN
jgi:hypothetical protein